MENTESCKLERYIKLLLKCSPNIIMLLDKEDRIDYCTDSFWALMGIENSGLMKGVHFREVYKLFENSKFIENAEERFPGIINRREAAETEVSIEFPGSGEKRIYTIQTIPLINENGGFEGTQILYRIIDSRRSESDERTHVMLDATPMACSLWDEAGNLLDCNREAMRMFGVSKKSDFFEYFRRFYPEFQPDGLSSSEKAKQIFNEVLKTNHYRIEWTYLTAEGETLPAELTLERIKWKDGYCIANYIRDLRESKANEQKLREADKRNREMEIQALAAKAAAKTKSNFFASMSHEIRTPMNAIVGMSDMIGTDNLNDEQKKFFSDIKKMAKALLQIINDILDFSKIEEDKLDLIPLHFNLLNLFNNLSSVNRFMAESKGLKFRYNFGPDVPRIVYGDDVRIRRILMSILNNAIKYTWEGMVEFQVDQIMESEREYTAFIVKDTGTGIRGEDMPNLFNGIERIDNQKKGSITGTGLGLAISKHLVDMMNGRIYVKSEYGKGTIFTVLLPLREGDPSKIERFEFPAEIKTDGNVKVLVVDDNSINLKVVLAYLVKHNIHADTASSGEEALQKIQQKHYHLLFMDYMMPGMNGIETTAHIRALDDEWYRIVPIIAFSANAVTGAREFFITNGMNDLLSKPLDAGSLNRILVKWLPSEAILRSSVTTGALLVTTPIRSAYSIEMADWILIDGAAGLINSANDEVLYRQLLEDFRYGHGADTQKINAALKAGDTKQARRLAHTLKSSAAQIGAKRLSAAAQDVELDIQKEAFVPPPEHLEKLDAEFSALIAELTRIVPLPASPIYGGGELNKTNAKSLVKKLEPLLKSGNTDSLKLADEIRKTFASIDECRTLIEHIEDFDFSDAAEILDKIKKKIEGK
ncbi:MAG: response regulator [Treponema sp.]|jgi:PAS domain S-box-containing protein|nr:response regulator [Treponema sp.]